MDILFVSQIVNGEHLFTHRGAECTFFAAVPYIVVIIVVVIIVIILTATAILIITVLVVYQ